MPENGFVPIWVTIAKFLVSQCKTCGGCGQILPLRLQPFVPCPDCKDLRALVETGKKGEGG